MKTIRVLLICLFISIAGSATAIGIAPPPNFQDYEFNQDKMQLSPTGIYVLSSFENNDYITAYTYKGQLLWEAPFHAKVVSWKIAGDAIFVLSKSRNANKSYLTSLDKFSGLMLWQRP